VAALTAVERGHAVLIDVREEAEVAQGMPAPATWLPLSRIARDPNVLLAAAPSRRGVIFCCGEAAWSAARRIAGMRPSTAVLADLEEWRATGLPMKAGPQPRVALAGNLIAIEPAAGPAQRELTARVRVADGEISVRLGPAWFVFGQGIAPAPADQVVVRGSTASADGAQAFFAVEVQFGGKTLHLRTDDGAPLWRAH
jgi:hypothetical protein